MLLDTKKGCCPQNHATKESHDYCVEEDPRPDEEDGGVDAADIDTNDGLEARKGLKWMSRLFRRHSSPSRPVTSSS